MARAVLKLALLVVSLASSVGCFDDPQAGDTAGETGACPDGSAGCECYGNNTCDGDLLCEEGICKAEECVAGSLNCDCYQGECFSGLVCSDGTCKPEEALPGCESVADCDGNLCTQGDQTCEQNCVAGVEVQCPSGAVCDSSSGSCLCDVGNKPCGDVCIPDTQCCTDSDCGGGSTCAEGFCTCDGGLFCNGQCVIGAMCCPGETSSIDCLCGGKRTCMDSGEWTSCEGGNDNPECESGIATQCGNCGTQTCTAECTWTECQGQGECEFGTTDCQAGKFVECTESCFWTEIGSC